MMQPESEAQSSVSHVPVMEREVVEMLAAQQGGKFLDCTLGGGGHTQALLEAHPENQVVACDRDIRALERSRIRLFTFGTRVEFHQARFSQISTHVAPHSFDGVLADLGLSSQQLAEGRGFSFYDSGPLDMRMNEEDSRSAELIVNALPEKELRQVLLEGGVSRHEAQPITKAVLRGRPIHSSQHLAQVINHAIGDRTSKRHVNPATVAFQAIRMAVNEELDELRALLATAPQVTRPSGRLAIISFHSLEDKIVARQMRLWQAGEGLPALWPGSGQESTGKNRGKIVTKKALQASPDEVAKNPRARSAKLRVFQFLNEGRERGGIYGSVS